MGENGNRLKSWKEIAAYLGREVRTVQLWEKNEGLPVHRHVHGKQGSVYALEPELDSWRAARTASPVAPVPEKPSRRIRLVPILATVGVLLTISSVVAYRILRASAATRPPISSIAVLPFRDLSPLKDSEYFSDGLTEEIIDALSHVPKMRVVARTSSFAFKGQDTDIREIGRKLGVDAVIEGSVRKSGDLLRITAQLNLVSNGYHVWSHTYDRPLRDVFSVQREISQAVASEVPSGGAPLAPSRKPTEDLEAYRLYQEGRFFFNRFEVPESSYRAIERYRAAIARDPNFAAAYAGIADAYSYLAENFAVAPRQVMPKAKETAEQALALDGSSAEAHTSLGIEKLDYERDVSSGQREFLRALELNPGFAWARHWYAHSLEAQNRVEDALREMRAALVLDPLSIPIHWDVAGELIILKRYDEARQLLARAAELFPGVPLFRLQQAVLEQRSGHLQAARDCGRTGQEPGSDAPEYVGTFAAQDALEGQVARARRRLAELEQAREKRYVEPFLAVMACAALKDRRLLLTWLERAKQEHSPLLVYAKAYAPYWGLTPEDLAALPAI